MPATADSEGCSPLCTVSPCWLCVRLDGAPDLTSLPQLMASDQHRGWKRGLLAALEVKFHHGNEPAWSPDGAGVSRRICDEHNKLSFM